MTRNDFFDRVYPEPMSGCWLWIGRTNHDGYGSLHKEDNEFGTYTAHRYSFLIHKGEIPYGLSVLHSCDVRCCVNPGHLSLGTQTENIADMDRKKRRNNAKGELQGFSKITEKQAIEIKTLYSTGNYRQKDIAEMFGVNRSVVSCIANGRTWTHVSGISDISRHKKRNGGYLKLNEVDVKIIRECISMNFSQSKIAAYFNLSQTTISGINTGKLWKNLL